MARRRDGKRGHDDEVELVGFRRADGGLGESEPGLLQLVGTRKAKRHDAGIGIDGRIGNLNTAAAEGRVEGSEVDLVLVFDGPEERDALRVLHDLERREPFTNLSGTLLARSERRRLAQATHALSELGLHAPRKLLIRSFVHDESTFDFSDQVMTMSSAASPRFIGSRLMCLRICTVRMERPS